MRRRSLLAFLADLPLVPTRLTRSDEVDVLLVLAVDVSGSIGPDEAKLQREGYCGGMLDSKVLAAIRGGLSGAIGVAYIEWAEANFQRLVIPWTRIASAVDAATWSDSLRRAQYISGDATSISGAIDFSRWLFAEAPWKADRRVIDISGDGTNTHGGPVQEARDRAVAAGITINGLAIKDGNRNSDEVFDVPADLFGEIPPQFPDTADNYRKEVIGGFGAFVIDVEDFTAFADALRRKLVREVAGSRFHREYSGQG